jgi:oxalate decarboxylase/phosphoglucose isomerase-like protein (cupin superfamily)
MNTIYPGQAALFPQGAIHFQQNLGCEPVIFVAAFSFEDPGTSTIANNFFSLPDDIVSATLGQIGVQEVLGLEKAIPKNVIYGVQ